MSDLEKLPKGWLELPVSEVIQTKKGKKPKDLGNASSSRAIPYINIKAFEKKVVTEYAPEQDAVECNEDDVLLVWDGARSGLSGRGIRGYVGSTLARVRSDLVNVHYLSYFFESIYSILNTQTKGVGIPHVNPVVLNNLPFYLPPEKEQPRIVERLDELFSELDAGVKELKAAQVKLTQYRHSLLKSAMEGALTQKWRDENKGSIEESGEQLLERILIERKQRWEQQKLAEFKAKNKTPSKNWQDKYPEPVKPDTSNLPELPQGWVWASLDMIIANIEAGKSFKCLERPPVFDEYGVVKVSAVTWGEYNELESKTCTRPELENDKILINEGDFLFSRANTTELVGACVIAKNITKKVMLSDKILRLRFVEDSLKYWILQFMRGELGRKQIEFSATGNQASMKNVSQGKLLKFAVPLPSLNEVEEIQGNLLSAFENTANAASEVSTTLKILNAQRKNILKSAFSGELVPQDSSDEPALLLLDKIKKEREQLAKIAKPKRVQKMPTMNKITVNNLTKWLNNKKEKSFTFEQIKKEFRGDYDLLKECIFEMLSEKKPLIKQVFDQETSAIKFIKEDK